MTAMDQLSPIVGVTCAIGAGVMGGTMFAFSVSVMPALRRLPTAQGITAMQAINVAIMNPAFLLLFFGTFVANLLLVVLALVTGAPWLLLGALLYLVGMIGVTAAFNVPLNTALDKIQPTSEAGAALWRHYLTRWTTWNHIRAFACAAAATVLTLTLA